jgi:hypothetical protein
LIVGNYFLQQGQSDGDKRRAPRRFEAALAKQKEVGAAVVWSDDDMYEFLKQFCTFEAQLKSRAMLQLDAQPNVGGPHVHQVLERHQRYK